VEVQADPFRVRLLDRPPNAPAFDAASTTLARNGKAYVLCVARIIEGSLR
jgi:hypothetical protein